jgi:hypothetical protein
MRQGTCRTIYCRFPHRQTRVVFGIAQAVRFILARQPTAQFAEYPPIMSAFVLSHEFIIDRRS